MRPFWKKMLSCAMAFVCLIGAAAELTGCHGSKERAAFEVPESFDTTKQYEITFWAKNDTNIRQTDIYKKSPCGCAGKREERCIIITCWK